MTNTQDNYITNTRNVITASKIKMAQMNLKAYKIIYRDTPDDVAQAIEDSKADHFKFGTMAHKLLEKFTEENVTVREIVDAFLEEYDITNRYQKKDLTEMILQKDIERGMDEVDVEVKRKQLMKMTLDSLREVYFGPDKYADITKKTKITRAEARDLIIGQSEDPRIADSVLKVAIANKDRDMKGKYSTEERIQATYKGKTLGAKPDRLVFYYEDSAERITLQELDTMTEGMTREQRREFSKKNKIKGLIRDYKTGAEAIKNYNQILHQGDTKYGYIRSMAFYYLIIRVEYGVNCEVKLDFIEKTAPYFSYTHTVPENIMVEKVKAITSTLDAIIEAEETGDRGTLSVEDILENPNMKTYYPLLAEHLDSHNVYADMI